MSVHAALYKWTILALLSKILSGKCIFQFHSHQHTLGNFSSPQFPGNYSESLECVYNFQGREYETLQLTFHDFDLERPFRKGCLTDYVDISTITVIGSKFLVGRYCGAEIPSSMLFMNPHAEIIFKTNLVVHGRGFHGSYHFQDEKSIPPPQSTSNVSHCGGTVTGVGGIIVSPGYPYYFPQNVDCIWLLRVPYHQKIYVRIIRMQLYGSIANCAESELTLYDGYSSISFNPKVLQKYCGDLRYYKNVEEQTCLSSRNRLLLRFKTSASQIMKGEDLDNNAVGFKIIWTAVEFKKEGQCTEFMCRDSRYCLSSVDNSCTDVLNYCIDKSLVCNGYSNCGGEDHTDEDRCNIPLMAGCAAAGGALFLSLCIGFCINRRHGSIRTSRSMQQLQLRQLEHSPSYSVARPLPSAHFCCNEQPYQQQHRRALSNESCCSVHSGGYEILHGVQGPTSGCRVDKRNHR